jgi:hypothetical protein
LIPGIVECALPYERESLARRTTDNNVNLPTGALYYLGTCDLGRIGTDRGALREVVRMNRRMDWIEFQSGGDIETGLLKPEPESPCACE